MSDAVRIGQILRERRESIGLSQREVAHETNMSIRGVEDIELGKSNPKWSSIIRIAYVLDMDLGDLSDCLNAVVL